jgi:hypothetical protein
MKRAAAWTFMLLAGTLPVLAQGTAPYSGPVISYTLLDGSAFIDDCLICGRPTILQSLRGTFDLVVEQDIAPYTRYSVRNVDLTTSPGFAGVSHLTGQGTYERFEEFARLQDMTLALEVNDAWTNKLAFFTNDTRAAIAPFPRIAINLTQTNGTLLQTYSLQLVAAPVREIWFSVKRGFTSTNRFSPTNKISAGDLLSNRGRIVKRNSDLVGRLGLMPMIADIGLDAVQVVRGGEILVSIPWSVFSESLGPIQHGDLVSDRGVIVKRNQALLAAFKLPSTNDMGLDAVQTLPTGETLFSITSNIVVSATLTLGRGDILSDRGCIFQAQRQLLANFQPAVTNRDFGLDALCLLPSGEIWFSVEEGFVDSRLGPIQEGDLLSDRGCRVLSNRDLLAAFAPQDPTQDYGLDAVFVVTDTCAPKPPPRIVKWEQSGGIMHLQWDGDGDVFQLESAATPIGPWQTCSGIIPALSYGVTPDSADTPTQVYRLRQW